MKTKTAKSTTFPTRRNIPNTVVTSQYVESWRLPVGWMAKSIGSLLHEGSILDLKDGNHGELHPKKNEFSKSGVPFITAAQINDFDIDYIGAYKLEGKPLERLKVGFAKKNDVILTHKGSIGKVAIAKQDCVLSPQATYYRLNPDMIDARYLARYFSSPFFITQLRPIRKQTTRDYVSITKQYELFIVLPPLETQKKIVQKLDYILGQLEEKKKEILNLQDKIDYLALIQNQRNFLLTTACTGQLTETWRKEHSSIPEATSLLMKIVENRRRSYEKLCQSAKDLGKKKPRPQFSFIIKKMSTDNTLPKTWTRTDVGFLAFVTKLAGFEYTKHIKLEDQGEVPVIRAQNVQMDNFVESNIKFISKKTSDFLERSQINGNEILMVFIGAGTGNVCLAPKGRRWHLAPNVAKIEVDGINREYLYYYLQSSVGVKNVLSRLKTNAQPSLSMGTIRQIIVNLPPLEEQNEIVRILKDRLERLQFVQKQISDLIQKKQHLKDTIEKLPSVVLSQAFSGKLVN